MEKVVLKNGTEIEILNGATENSFSVLCCTNEEVTEIVNKLTEENMSEYKILAEDGTECTTLADKYVKSYTVNTEENTVTFKLANVDMVLKRVTALEETQALQDEAITELAEMAAEEV